MSPHSRTEKILAVPCTYCEAEVGQYCTNIANGKYARAYKTVTHFHWQRKDDAKQLPQSESEAK